MVKGTTASGFSYEVDEGTLDDMDFIEAVAEMSSGSPAGAMDVIERVLGKEQKEALKAHLRELHGRAKFSDFMAELNEIIEAAPTLKNS